MFIERSSACLVALSLLVSAGGCITGAAMGAGLATKTVGNRINDADIREKQEQLLGKGAADADRILGRRTETLVDTSQKGRELLVYAVDDKTRYVVELRGDKIVAISKKLIDRNMIRDALKRSDLEKKLIGRTPAECERIAELRRPKTIFKSEETDTILRVYETTGKLDLGARYLVLRFDVNERCSEIGLVEVSATSKSN